MILVIDVGNTNITLGIYSGAKLVGHWRLSTSNAYTEDEIWIFVKKLCESDGIQLEKIAGIALGSVVPTISTILGRMIEKRFRVDYLEVNSTTRTGIRIRYDNPAAVGADRICNAVAAFKNYGGPIVIVDFGTATTFDVVSKNAEYLGGIIAPGLESAVNSLHRFAAKLPLVDLKFPDQLIGANTETSIQSGVMFGGAEMVEGLIRRLKRELGEATRVVTTGGLAAVLMPYLPSVDRTEPFLTLDGLYQIYTLNFPPGDSRRGC